MPDPHQQRRFQRMRELWRRHEESQAALGVIMAGIAALFVAGIVGAFLFAKDTSTTMVAGRVPMPPVVNAPAPSASAPSMREPETTGSGGVQQRGGGGEINRTPPPHDPREDEQNEKPPR